MTIASTAPTPTQNLPRCEECQRRHDVALELSRGPWGLLVRELSIVMGREPPLFVSCDFACVRWGSA